MNKRFVVKAKATLVKGGDVETTCPECGMTFQGFHHDCPGHSTPDQGDHRACESNE